MTTAAMTASWQVAQSGNCWWRAARQYRRRSVHRAKYSLSRIVLKICFVELGIVPAGKPVAWRNSSITSVRPPGCDHNRCNSVSRSVRVFFGSLVIALAPLTVTATRQMWLVRFERTTGPLGWRRSATELHPQRVMIMEARALLSLC
jgi:hypothetical protein